jgi:hypothetical protein
MIIEFILPGSKQAFASVRFTAAEWKRIERAAAAPAWIARWMNRLTVTPSALAAKKRRGK